jgi:hypothetical protein
VGQSNDINMYALLITSMIYSISHTGCNGCDACAAGQDAQYGAVNCSLCIRGRLSYLYSYFEKWASCIYVDCNDAASNHIRFDQKILFILPHIRMRSIMKYE